MIYNSIQRSFNGTPKLTIEFTNKDISNMQYNVILPIAGIKENINIIDINNNNEFVVASNNESVPLLFNNNGIAIITIRNGIFSVLGYLENPNENIISKIEDFNEDNNNITSLRGLFRNNKIFNQDISDWNVSNIENMGRMFQGALKFNKDISGWNVSKVIDMTGMFKNTTEFNCGDGKGVKGNKYINNTVFSNSIKNVISMGNMFYNASSFNQDISNWDVSNVKFMSFMLAGASMFNQNINKWNVSNVRFMTGMFVDLKFLFNNLKNIFSQFTDVGELELNEAIPFFIQLISLIYSDEYLNILFDNFGINVDDLGSLDINNIFPNFISNVFEDFPNIIPDIITIITSSSGFNEEPFINILYFLEELLKEDTISSEDKKKLENIIFIFYLLTNIFIYINIIFDVLDNTELNPVENIEQLIQQFKPVIFNQDINIWDVFNVINMSLMFGGVSIFNNGKGTNENGGRFLVYKNGIATQGFTKFNETNTGVKEGNYNLFSTGTRMANNYVGGQKALENDLFIIQKPIIEDNFDEARFNNELVNKNRKLTIYNGLRTSISNMFTRRVDIRNNLSIVDSSTYTIRRAKIASATNIPLIR
jgi:surface protein